LEAPTIVRVIKIDSFSHPECALHGTAFGTWIWRHHAITTGSVAVAPTGTGGRVPPCVFIADAETSRNQFRRIARMR